VGKGLPKGLDFFLHHSDRLVQVEPLNEHTNVVTFQIGPRALIQALQSIAYELRPLSPSSPTKSTRLSFPRTRCAPALYALLPRMTSFSREHSS
jgi:hypothetical protein